MKPEEVGAILEALLFVADGPVETGSLAAALPEEARSQVETALEKLMERCEQEGRGIRLVRLAGGWRLQTRPDLYTWVSEFLKIRRTDRLSRPALETLAIITYRQPITAPEIAAVRGVDPTAALKTLLEKGLVRIAGRKNVVGKPFLYATTKNFLEEFGLDTLDDLPDLKEFEDLLEERYIEPRQELFRAGDAAEAGQPGATGDAGKAEHSEGQEEEADRAGTGQEGEKAGPAGPR